MKHSLKDQAVPMLLLVKVSVSIVNHNLCCFLSYLVDPNSQNQFTLSRQDSAKWDAGAGSGSDATLKYSLQDGAVLRQVEITLKCDTNVDGDLVSLGEFGTALYKFELTSKCACWDGCKGE